MPMCAVSGCTNRPGGDRNVPAGVKIKFFKMPTVRLYQGEATKQLSEERRQLWKVALNRKDRKTEEDWDKIVVCSRHFVNGLQNQSSVRKRAGRYRMKRQDPVVKTEVKLEIDVAEEPPQSWYMTEKHPHVSGREDVNIENKASIQMEQTAETPGLQDQISSQAATGCDRMEQQRPVLNMEVKREIDLDADPPQAWYRAEKCSLGTHEHFAAESLLDHTEEEEDHRTRTAEARAPAAPPSHPVAATSIPEGVQLARLTGRHFPKSTRRGPNGRNKHFRCHVCYMRAKVRGQKGRALQKTKPRLTSLECPDCDKKLCLECFKIYHTVLDYASV